MQTNKLVRWLAALALAITSLEFLYSFVVWEKISETTARLLSLNGLDGILGMPDWLFHVYYLVQVVSLVSLVVGWRWAKYLFIANVAFFAFSTLLFGIGISLPVEIFLATLLSYIYGAILILLIFSGITESRIDLPAADS